VKVAFLLNDLGLSGGVGVVARHAHLLRDAHGIESTLVLSRTAPCDRWSYEALEAVPVLTIEQARTEQFDVAVATWWETTAAIRRVRAHRHAYFVQSLEDRFYEPEHIAQALGARSTLDLPVVFVTEARWIRDTLRQLRPDVGCYYVRNGIDKDVFRPLECVSPRTHGPLRILVEGRSDSWFKGLPDAIAAIRLMRESHFLTVVDPAGGSWSADRVFATLTPTKLAEVYAETDVMVKLSRVEGMYGPPLEAFHLGATCVTTPVTGHSEFVVHGWNALVVDWDDLSGTARALDLLAVDRRLLHFLRTNALATARTWPDLRQSSEFMALALRRIANEPMPMPPPDLERLRDVRLRVHEWQAEAARLPAATGLKVRILNRLWANPWGARLLRLYGETGLARIFRPLIRRILR
jgi:glycosyltransferase involved in cell wall biosynthesis